MAITKLLKLQICQELSGNNLTYYNAFLELVGQKSDDAVIATPSTNDSNLVEASASGEQYFLSRGSSKFGDIYNDDIYVRDTIYYWTDILDDMITLKNTSNAMRTGSRIIADLATYFRYGAAFPTGGIVETVKGLKNVTNIQIQSQIMYAILVVQSVILFIAYIKRLFYVIMLAMMAPIVVVFDFFQKFGK